MVAQAEEKEFIVYQRRKRIKVKVRYFDHLLEWFQMSAEGAIHDLFQIFLTMIVFGRFKFCDMPSSFLTLAA
jgi:hypothetical protein